MVCFPRVVDFLESEESLKAIDWMFRELVRCFHQIPFCATLGVSCSGHLILTHEDETGSYNADILSPEFPLSKAEKFWPIKLRGDLNIIVHPFKPYIRELLAVIQAEVSKHTCTSFVQCDHLFGPPPDSVLEVWQIAIDDNGCLKPLDEFFENGYVGQVVSLKDHLGIYRQCYRRGRKIRRFWQCLTQVVSNFCQGYGFNEFDLEARVNELGAFWE